MLAVFIILAVFSVPLVAIVSSTWLKYQKLHVGDGGADLRRKVALLEAHNAELASRIETLETIVTAPAGVEGARQLRELEAPAAKVAVPKLAAR